MAFCGKVTLQLKADITSSTSIARVSLFNTALRTEYISLRGTFPSSAYYEYVRRLFTVYEYSVYE